MGFLTGQGLGGSNLLFLPRSPVIPFVSNWNTANTSTGSSTSTQIQLPLVSDGIYNFEVDWGDGSTDTITSWNQSETLHEYGSSDTPQITITGTLIGWAFDNSGDRLKFISVDDWGDVTVDADGAFRECQNMISWVGVPLVRQDQANGRNFMRGCRVFNSPLDGLDLSAQVSLDRAFENLRVFNRPISGIIFNPAANLGFIFNNAFDFNQPIDSMITLSTTTVSFMFNGATDFDQPLNNLQSQNITDFSGFLRAKGGTFNSRFDLDVRSATTMSDFITNTSVPAANYDQALNFWATLPLQSNVTLDMGSNNYTAAGATARASIISTYGWTINDGGQI